MSVDDVSREWNTLGERDPLWAILTHPGKAGGRWDPEEFFATGTPTFEKYFVLPAARLGYPRRRRIALDFGCGVGRVTHAMTAHFDHVIGVDAAAAMIDLAVSYNTEGDRVEYVLNESADLSLFDDASFDLVFSNLVLQHLGPTPARAYMREFVRICAPDGLIVFGLPDSMVVTPEMDEEAYRAVLHHVGPGPGVVGPNEAFTVLVELHNNSDRTWHVAGGSTLGIGDHWLDANGSMVRLDDGRAYITEDLPPWSSTVLQLTCQAPPVPGRYELEVDGVHEGVTWFVDRGHTEPVRVRVDVVGSSASDSAPVDDIADGRVEGRMQIFAIRRPEVEATLEGAGARVLDVVETPRCGPAWVFYEYYATVPGHA